jgi:hypothetical protein
VKRLRPPINGCDRDGKGGRAAGLNALFDEWGKARSGEPVESIARFGTVDWLFREFRASNHYRERVSPRTRPDYERTMALVTDMVTKKGDTIGQRLIKPSRRFRLIGYINWSARGHAALDRGRAKRSSHCAVQLGEWYIGSIQTSSTVMFLIRGMV